MKITAQRIFYGFAERAILLPSFEAGIRLDEKRQLPDETISESAKARILYDFLWIQGGRNKKEKR